MFSFQNIKKIIPNFFTALNMAFGFVSVVEAVNGNYTMAALLIILAAVADALDGLLARLTKTSSRLGVELDSLADVISFGFAPAFLLWKSYFFQFDYSGIFIAVLFLVAGGYRLARFNSQLVGFDKEYFVGLPIPVSAITIASFVLLYYKNYGFVYPTESFILPLTILLAFLMVSRIKYDTLPKPSKSSFKEKPFHFGFIFIALVILTITSGEALFYIFMSVIIFGVIRQVYNMLFRKTKTS